MRIVVLGAGGLIGAAVVRVSGARAEGGPVIGLTRAACDVTESAGRERVLRDLRPDAVIFAAAATDVDGVARSAESLRAARRVNVEAPAAWARKVETWFLSSNFVFDGPGPHLPGEAPRPCMPYGEQKAEAEAAVLAAGGHVVRVGWVYGPGGRRFASTAADRLARGEATHAIADVVVQPTHADDVAAALLALPRGVTHLAGAGETTWYGYALALWARVGRGKVIPVRSEELGLGPRPRDARLAPAGLPPWRAHLPPWSPAPRP
jgi:dTDP-4-dehydrorhamnose reductase